MGLRGEFKGISGLLTVEWSEEATRGGREKAYVSGRGSVRHDER